MLEGGVLGREGCSRGNVFTKRIAAPDYNKPPHLSGVFRTVEVVGCDGIVGHGHVARDTVDGLARVRALEDEVSTERLHLLFPAKNQLVNFVLQKNVIWGHKLSFLATNYSLTVYHP